MKDKISKKSRIITLLISLAIFFNVFAGMPPVFAMEKVPDSLIINAKDKASIEDLKEELNVDDAQVEVLYDKANIIKIDNISHEDYQTIKESDAVTSYQEDKLYPVETETNIPPINTMEDDLKSLGVRDSFDYNKNQQINYSGDNNIIVGVIDTGIDSRFTDYKRFYNTKEIPNNGIDDDGNGYVDDFSGWNFFEKESRYQNYTHLNYGGLHGTSVASIIGGQGNNGLPKGIAPNVRIADLSIISADGQWVSDSALISAVNYADKMGIGIINMSLGVPFDGKAVEEALNNYKGIFIISAGNDGKNLSASTMGQFRDLNINTLIRVGALDRDNYGIASYTTYSNSLVDVATKGTCQAADFDGVYWKQKTFSGASCAAAVTSGLMALLKSKNQTFTNVQLKNKLLDTSDKAITTPDNRYINYGAKFKYGRVNPYKLVETGNVPSTIIKPTPYPTPQSLSLINNIIRFDSRGGTAVSALFRIQGQQIGTLPISYRSGFDFRGWYTSINGQGIRLTSDAIVYVNRTYYAYFTVKAGYRLVKFNVNGGKALSISKEDKAVKYKSQVGALPTPARTGYTFKGWYTARSGGTKITTLTRITANTTFYARWTIKTYSVKFNSMKGSRVSAKKIKYNHAIGTLKTPRRYGYAFKGWYTAKSGGNKIYKTTRIKNNHTYYAHWKRR